MNTHTFSRPKYYHPAIILALGLSGGMAFAAGTANDSASNYAPGSWGTSPANLGSGFGPWSVSVNNSDNPPYVGTYLANVGDTPIVDSGGNSWATYANGGDGSGSISFSRAFLPGASTSSSLYNQTFSFDLGSGGVGPGQGLLSVAVGNSFLFQYVGTGSDSMLFSSPTSGSLSTGVGFGNLSAGLVVSLSVSGALNSPSEGYAFSVSPFSGGSPLYTTSGTFDSSGFNTSSFTFSDANTTGNGYFNDLSITPEAVPEPSSLVLLGMGLAGFVSSRRRK